MAATLEEVAKVAKAVADKNKALEQEKADLLAKQLSALS